MVLGQFDSLDYTPRQVHDHLHVRLLAIDEVRLGHTWAARGVRSPFWRLYVNNRAGAMVEIDRDDRPPSADADGRLHPLTPGAIHLVPAWLRFNCWNEVPLEHFFIHFDPVGWAPAVVRELFDQPLALPPSPIADQLLAAITAALRATRAAPPSAESGTSESGGNGENGKSVAEGPATLALAKALVYHSLSRLSPKPAEHEARCGAVAEGGVATAGNGRPIRRRQPGERWAMLLEGPSPVNAAVRHIESHLAGEIDNETLARLCHLSRSHFIRLFHRTVGQTPAQYIRERRVARAAEDLVLTRAKIDEVAARWGFANRFYFSRAFTEVMGMPPAKYRGHVV